MLSRLEARRGGDPRDAQQVMPIDVGSGLKPLELPLGRNVLYVGTMNEDETTQTVSDKVLDRGNVLTFPRPHHLKSRALEPWRGQPNALPATVWRQWIREPAEVLHPEVRNRIRIALEQVNTGLGHVQRAIGHRVLQAIEAYIANHPRTVDSVRQNVPADHSWQLAFEDQLVQKLMPKLRGIEVRSETGDQAIGEVRAVIDTLAPSLATDFGHAAGREDGVFAWTTSQYLDGVESAR